MAIESNPFGGVRLTGVDALAFRRQFLGEDIPEPPSDSDGSGEAGETGTGSTEGDSAGPKDIAETPAAPHNG